MTTEHHVNITETADQSRTAFSTRYQQTYHSTHGAKTESMHVYVNGAGVQNRLITQKPTRVLEIGFGLGLNFLLSADLAESHACPLSYVSVEHSPIDSTLLRSLRFDTLLQNQALIDELATVMDCIAGSANKPVDAPPQQRLSDLVRVNEDKTEATAFATKLGACTELCLFVADASANAFARKLETLPPFDAIYLDAFSPEHNPECWTRPFLEFLSGKLAKNGVLVTYSVRVQLVNATLYYIHKI